MAGTSSAKTRFALLPGHDERLRASKMRFRAAPLPVYDRGQQEAIMNEDVFNTSLRKFLKKVGITSQREIEKAVRDALEAGRLKGNEKLPAKIVLTVGGVNLTHEVKDEIELG